MIFKLILKQWIANFTVVGGNEAGIWHNPSFFIM